MSYHLDDENSRERPGDFVRFFHNFCAFYFLEMNDALYDETGLYGNYGLGIDFGCWAMNYRRGLQVDLTKQTRVGITWTSELNTILM